MRRIPLRRHDGSVRAYALVDDADFDWLNQWRWCLRGCRIKYVGRAVGGKRHHRIVYMHRQLLDLEHGDPRQGEHENRNPLDNRRANLRIAEGQRENQQNRGPQPGNTTGLRGVVLRRDTGRYQTRVALDGRTNYLGCFDTPEEADVVVKAFRAQHMPFSEDARAA